MLQVKLPQSMTPKAEPVPESKPHDPPPTQQNIVNAPLPETLTKEAPPPPNITASADFIEPPINTLHQSDPTQPRKKKPTTKRPPHIYEGEDHQTKPAEITEIKKETPPNSNQSLLYGLQDIQHETINKGEIHPEQPEIHIISERHPKHHKGAGWHSILSVENHHPRKPHIDDLKKVRYQSKHHLKQAVLKRLVETRKRSHIPYDPNPIKKALI